MSIITYKHLEYINNRYDLSKLLPYIKTRYNRMSFERVIACILQINNKHKSLLGNIHKYCRWGIKYEQISKYKHLPIIKVWTGR